MIKFKFGLYQAMNVRINMERGKDYSDGPITQVRLKQSDYDMTVGDWLAGSIPYSNRYEIAWINIYLNYKQK